MTTRATGFLIAAMAFAVIALSTGSSIYYLFLGAMALTLVLSALCALCALWTTRVAVRCSRRNCVRGESLPLQIRLRHASALPFATHTLVICGCADRDVRMEVFALPFQTKASAVSLTLGHRGLYEIGVRALEVSDVFSLFCLRRRLSTAAFRVEVLPKTWPMPGVSLMGGNEGDSRYLRSSEDYASPDGVRAWMSGDALKKVHWKLSARKQELMVRTYEESVRPDTLVLPDLTGIRALKRHALTLEDAICEGAASIVLAQLKAGNPVRMPLVASRPMEVAGVSQGEMDRFLSALARAQFDCAIPYEQVVSSFARQMGRTGAVVLITARVSAELADAALRLCQIGLSVALIWVSDSRRGETLELLSQLNHAGVRLWRMDPWADEGVRAVAYEEAYA